MKKFIFFFTLLLNMTGEAWSFEGQVKTAYYIDENGEKAWIHLANIDLSKAMFTNCSVSD